MLEGALERVCGWLVEESGQVVVWGLAWGEGWRGGLYVRQRVSCCVGRAGLWGGFKDWGALQAKPGQAPLPHLLDCATSSDLAMLCCP